MSTSARAKGGVDRQSRRREVEAALQALGRPASARRLPPPDGRLSADEEGGRQLRDRLIDLGPVFSSFGRYLASRVDLLPRRIRTELGGIPDAGAALPAGRVAALIRKQLGSAPDRLFFEFHDTPFTVATWIQRHLAWLSPGVPAVVTVVRPDAMDLLDRDVSLLPLIGPWIDVPDALLAAAVDDYAATLRRRLDQKHQAASLTTLAADARAGGGFDAPVCYRDHCSANILTVERLIWSTLDEHENGGEALARRVTAAWVRQAFSGSVVPFDFGPRDLVVADDRLILTSASFEPSGTGECAHFAAYLSAVAGDDPDVAATWILEGARPAPHVEVELRRALRQAVPFREGEWSGDDRLAEHALVQWRVAREAGWPVSSHHLHLYKGLHAVTQMAIALAPETDTLLAALDDERMRIGLAQAGHLLDPRYVTATFERAVQQLAELPQRLDDVLSMASEGRLRVKLNVPEGRESEEARNRTVFLVTALVAFTGVAAIVHQVRPQFGASAEHVGAVLLLVLGGWLLIAAARL